MKIKLRKKIIDLRKKRGSFFLHCPNNLPYFKYFTIFLLEFFGILDLSDKLLVAFVISDLSDRQIVVENPIKLEKYILDERNTYYDVYIRTRDNRNYCRGTSTNLMTSLAKAVGEVLERVSIIYPDKQENVFEKKVSETEGNENYFDFNLRAKPTQAQEDKFSDTKILPQDRFEFVVAKNLLTEASIFLPKQLVFFGHSFRQEKKIIQSTTHAAGSGSSFKDALHSAFFEVLHRHFFLKSWYQKKSPNILKVTSLQKNKKLYEKIASLQAKNFKINILDFREEANGLPTFICILEKFGGWYCGGSASLDIFYAIERSIDEAVSTYLWETRQTQNGNYLLNRNYIESVGNAFLDSSLNGRSRLLLFGNSYFIKRQDKFILSGKEVDLGEYENFSKENFDLKDYAEKLFGKNIYYKNLENIFLQEYMASTVKLYIPNSYYFPIMEMYGRPILSDQVLPTFFGPNPFP
jgi:thiazole/oxazole-forming peptide maturase SagD family component